MIQKLFAVACLCACTAVFTGCDKASSAASVASDAADKAKKEAAGKMDVMKSEVEKAVDLPALEAKANGLAADKKADGLSKVAEIKKMFEDFKGSTDLTKMGELKEMLMKKLAEVKTMLGM